ncbi:HAMP domain-containing sensor histidine kinase [Cysteiniphilum sp. QT6929]|nr:HAMP domain-containing sensor histidine kinase [Cysteiniphilum sp. QT6929]WHN64815.1 HAMP domain-containing histidine kinase [Cysteiniphilum sp. QT6929]
MTELKLMMNFYDNIKQYLRFWFFPILFIIFVILNLCFIVLSYQHYRDHQYHKTIYSLTNTTFQAYLHKNETLQSLQQPLAYSTPKYITYLFTKEPVFSPIIELDMPTQHRKNSHLLYTDIRKQIKSELGTLPFFSSKQVSICYADLKQCANFTIELPNRYYLYFLLLFFAIFMILVTPLHFLYKQKLVQPFLQMQKVADKLNISNAASAIKPFNLKNLVQLMEHTCQKLNALMDEKIYTIKAIAHDLKTPLTKAKLYMYNQIPEEHHGELTKYYNDMEYLLGQISTYTKKYYLNEKQQKIDLVDFSESVCHEYQLNGFNVSFSTNLKYAIIKTQHKALKRAMQNLIDNALKYAGNVMVEVQQENNQLHLLFIDKGPGVPKKHLAKLCDPFYRVDCARGHDLSGSGLGLAIVKEIVIHNKATLFIDNNPHSSGLIVKIIFREL